MMKVANAPEGQTEIMHRLRKRLGKYNYEGLGAEIDVLPDGIDRAAVWVVIYERAFGVALTGILEVRRWRRVDRAVRGVGRAIDHLKDILWHEMGLNDEQVEEHTRVLEREHEDLHRMYAYEGAPRSRYGVVSEHGGRPGGAQSAREALQALDMSRDQAQALLEVAGLAGTSPTK